jgi:hypothetical protein
MPQIYIQNEGSYIYPQPFSGLNFVQKNSLGIGTDTLIPIANPSNPTWLADIQTQDLWGYIGTGPSADIYRLTNVGIGTTNPASKLFVTQSGTSYSTNEVNTHAFAVSSGNNGRTMWMGYDDTIDAGYINAARFGLSTPIYLQTRNLTNATTVFVGIGTTQPTGTANQYLQVGGGAYVSGNLGIGLTNPGNKLHVVGTARIGSLASSRSHNGLTVGFTNNTTFTINTDVDDSIRIASLVNESTTTNAMSVLGFRVNPDGGTTNAMLDLKFVQTGSTNTSALHYSFNHGGTFADRFTILSSGNLGIGLTNPIRRLHLSQNSAAEFVIEQSDSRPNYRKWNFVADNGNSTTTGNFYLRLLNDVGNNETKLYWHIHGPTNTQSFYDTVLINTATTTGTASQRLQVTGGAYVSGNLGVGITNPTSKLDIDGNSIRLSNSNTPESASSAGNQGQICWDSSYIYVCVATNTWKRSSLSSW